jgi:replicative superfamily II helicase
MSKQKDKKTNKLESYEHTKKLRLIESRAKFDGITKKYEITPQSLENFIEKKAIPLAKIKKIKFDKGLRSQDTTVVAELYNALEYKEPLNIYEKLIIISYRCSSKLQKDINHMNIGFATIFDYAVALNKTLDSWVFGFGSPAVISVQDRAIINTVYSWEK